MSISLEFQNRFIDLVDELGEANKKTVAQKIHINYLTFCKIYNYGIIPKPIILSRIADFFNTSIEYLLCKIDTEYFERAKTVTPFIIRLSELTKEKGIKNYSELGSYIHLHRNSFYEWEKQDYLPSLEVLEILADFFDVSIDYLLGRTDERHN